MTDAFLDTVGLLAVWNVSDQWHADATKVYQDLVSQRRPMLTTTYVLLECGNAAARSPLLRRRVINARRWLEANQKLIVPTDADWANAWAAYERGQAGQAGIIDHVSFSVMRRLGLSEAFTNDGHFRAAGFPDPVLTRRESPLTPPRPRPWRRRPPSGGPAPRSRPRTCRTRG